MQWLLRTRGSSIMGFAAVVLIVVFAVHGPALRYPYVQEDWEMLGALGDQPTWSALVDAFRPSHQLQGIYYRPLTSVYFVILRQVAGWDGRLSHALVLSLLAAASMASAYVVRQVTRDDTVAVLVGLTYAAANSIHVDPLLIQTCGIENFLGNFCFLMALLFFLQERNRASAVMFLLGLLCKETVLVLPALLLLAVVVLGQTPVSLFRRLVDAVPKLLGHAIVLAIYVVIRVVQGGGPLNKPENDPYYMSFFGRHLWTNFVAYLRWTAEALVPWPRVNADTVVLVLLLVCALGLGLALAHNLERARRLAAQWTFFTGWIALALSPMLILPNHTYRYYLEFAFPAVLALWWSALRAIGARFPGGVRSGDAAMLTLALLTIITAGMSFRDRSHTNSDLDGTNVPMQRATTVAQVQPYLTQAAAQLPRGATLLFDDIEVWAFGKELGPRLWCRDPGLMVFYARDMHKEPTGELVILNAARHQGEMSTGARNRTLLDPLKTFVLRRDAGTVLMEPVTTYLARKENPLPAEALFLVNFQPTEVETGRPFNVQPNGGSALGASARGLTPSTIIVIGGKHLEGFQSGPGLISTMVPPEVHAIPGEYPVYLLDTKTGVRSNELKLVVRKR